MEEKKKRERTSNFSGYEKQLLVNILSTPEIRVIIENKKTDGATIRQKDETWQNVVNIYNGNPQAEKREVNHLKRLYDNLKRSSKKKYALNLNKHSGLLSVNGQEFKKEPYLSDSVEEKLFSIMQPQVEPVNDTYETDKYEGTESPISVDKVTETNSSAVEIHPDYIYFVSDDDPENKPNTSTIGKDLLVLKDSVSTPSTSDCETTLRVTKNTPAPRRNKKTAMVARENIATLASSKSLLVEMEKSFLIKRHEEEMKLIALKIENEKKKSAVLDAKLLYYKNKK